MRASKLWAIVASAILLLSQQLSAPIAAHADTYQLVGLANDSGLSFYGMDDSGNVVFSDNQCPNYAPVCYKDMNTTTTTSTTLPNLTWDYTTGTCGTLLSPFPCSITNNGITATISRNLPGEENLSVSSGSNPAQLLLTTGFGGIFAINGIGDIVYDNGIEDEWFEAIDLSPITPATTTIVTPAAEPSALILLTTGILVPIFFLRRRRPTPATH